MSHKIIAAVAFAMLLGPAAARATVIDGSFSGTLTSGEDTTGVFGPASTGLTGDVITGTFVYVTSLFTPSIIGTQNTLTGDGPGALTVTVTIDGVSHTFTDNTSSSIFLDSGASQITITSADAPSGAVDEDFSLEADDIFTPFITSTDPARTFSTERCVTQQSGTVRDRQFRACDASERSVHHRVDQHDHGHDPDARARQPDAFGLRAGGVAGARGWRRGWKLMSLRR